MPRVIRWCFVLLLLCAQQAAFTHAISHATRGAPAGQSDRVVTAPAHHQHDTAAALCAFDAAFNQVLGWAAGTSGGGNFSAGLQELCTAPVPSAVVTAFLAPLSRGPPVFL